MTGTNAQEKTTGRSKTPLLVGAVSAVALGAGGFFSVYSGMLTLPFTEGQTEVAGTTPSEVQEAPTYVTLEEIMVSLPRDAPARHIRFGAAIEVAPEFRNDVENLTPRLMDLINTYLRAADFSDIHESRSLIRIRTHLFRRIQIISPPGSVRDLLITKFVLV